MSIDPYSAPAMHSSPVSRSSEAGIAQGVLRQLAGTKPWVRFISVLMFIGAGLMLLGALFMLVAGGTILKSSKMGAAEMGMMVPIAIAYALFAFLYIFPALKLWKYASRIGDLLNSGAVLDLEAALNEQRSFWKFVGIMALILLILYFVIFIGMIVVGGFAAMKAQGA